MPIRQKTWARVLAYMLTDNKKWQLYVSMLLLTLNLQPLWMKGMSMGRLAEIYGIGHNYL